MILVIFIWIVRIISLFIFSGGVSLTICTIYRFFYCSCKLIENSEYGYNSWFMDDLFFKVNNVGVNKSNIKDYLLNYDYNHGIYPVLGGSSEETWTYNDTW